MTKRIKKAWTAITMLGMVAGAARADGPAPMQPSPNSTPISMSDSTGVPAGAACDGNCDGEFGAGAGHCHIAGLFNPTRGFRPIETAPVNRDAVVYYRYWPDRWYGQPGWNLRPQFPQVYMPTDTTQLGFYYQRVPQWMPNPGMYPPAPVPSQWHRRRVYQCGAEPNCLQGVSTMVLGDSFGAESGGMIFDSTSAPPSPAPADKMKTVPPAQSPPPMPSQPAAPPPPMEPPAAPSASTQGAGRLQQTSDSGEHRWLLEDLSDMIRR